MPKYTVTEQGLTTVFSQNRSTATWTYSYCKRVASFTALCQNVAQLDIPRLTTITVILFVRVFIARFQYLRTNESFYLRPSSTVVFQSHLLSLLEQSFFINWFKLHIYSTFYIKRSARLFKIISVYRHLKYMYNDIYAWMKVTVSHQPFLVYVFWPSKQCDCSVPDIIQV